MAQALGSLFVASYDSQGYGGGIRTDLHTGVNYHYSQLAWGPRHIASGRTQQKTPFPNNPCIVAYVFVASGMCLPSRCLAVNISGSTIPGFRRHVTDIIELANGKNNTLQFLPFAATVAASSKARNIFDRSNTGIVGSNPTEDIAVCPLIFVFV
jgi:hypothetical protein